MSAAPPVTYWEGRPSDLRTTFELSVRVWDATLEAGGQFPPRRLPGEDVDSQWRRERPLLEFISAQPGGSYWLCEAGGRVVGYARRARFGSMDELTELWVDRAHGGQGVGRGLLARCWPTPPTPELGRLVITVGTPAALSLYTDFGVMPVTGHWHLRHRVREYVERRTQEVDSTEPAIHLLEAERAVGEWKRLEPAAIGHERPLLHEFFGRTRVCLGLMDAARGQAAALCWVSSVGGIGPAVGATPEALVPVVLAALDRVASAHEPEFFDVFCTTDSWWLLDRLRRLGFRVHWPNWLMSSVPLPELGRYLPTRPPLLL